MLCWMCRAYAHVCYLKKDETLFLLMWDLSGFLLQSIFLWHCRKTSSSSNHTSIHSPSSCFHSTLCTFPLEFLCFSLANILFFLYDSHNLIHLKLLVYPIFIILYCNSRIKRILDTFSTSPLLFFFIFFLYSLNI